MKSLGILALTMALSALAAPACVGGKQQISAEDQVGGSKCERNFA
jgi:hypothetical protein